MKLKLRYIFIANSIVGFIFGILFMVIPQILGVMIGFSPEADGPLVFRFFGSCLVVMAILLFLVRKEEFSPVTRSIAIAQIINAILETILHLAFCDLTNFWLWSIIVMHLLFLGLYIYCLIKKQ